ncbi:MAG: anthranilate phosphoribosyltransferase [Oligoflexales bacterium]|nr:anthranilate phosphoribosyltransferase [Oligoflexales bacterium]
MRAFLGTLFEGKSLKRHDAMIAMELMMSGSAHPAQVGAFLAALKVKGESVEEVTGMAISMRQHALPLSIKRSDLIDTCGTGGDGTSTFNISTATALVLAGGGLGVVKHGNRSVSSRSGSADVIEALGVAIDLPPSEVAWSVDEIGFGFLFARSFHSSMRHVAEVRSALGVRTVFNILGPLTNPAGVKRQVIGVYDHRLLSLMTEVLRELGSEEVMVVCGEDGVDEFSISGKTFVSHLKEGQISSYEVAPEDFGLKRADISKIAGGTAHENGKIIERILQGESGAIRDVVVLNAGAALKVSGKASDIAEGCRMAGDIIDSGRAYEILKKLRQKRR